MPPAFAVALLVVRNGQFSTFIAFGCFSLLVLADFGGHWRPKAVAYASTTAVGAVLVVIGTVASANPWTAAAVTLLVAFGIRFAGLFGGYAVAAQTALLLSFVLSVAVPAPLTAVVPRVAGWVVAGALAGLAAELLWPRFEHLHLMERAASACRALAQLVEASRQRQATAEVASKTEQASVAVGALHREYSTAPTRPAWPARRDRALVELISETGTILAIATNPFNRSVHTPPLPAGHPCLKEGDRLARVVVETLNASASVLTGGRPPLDPSRLHAASIAHRPALTDWARQALRSGTSPQEVLDGLAADETLNVIAYLTLALAQNALIAAGKEPRPEAPLARGVPQLAGAKGVLVAIAQALRAQLQPRSTVLHDSVRAAVGIGLAVLISRLLRLDHAFWVVLGTLSVLRSNALGTGRTTVEALIGTLAGFAVGVLIALAAGSNSAIAWAILPLAAFTAAFAWTAVGFVIGQAAFTVFVIVLFNLISPVGWRVGLVRIEDVAIGVGISVLVATLLWPWGARRDLARGVADLYRSVADFLAATLGGLLGRASPEKAARARSAALAARDRAGEALYQFLNERSFKVVDPERATLLFGAGKHAIMFGDVIDVLRGMGYRAGPGNHGIDSLSSQTDVLANELKGLATVLDGRGIPGPGSAVHRVSEDVLHEVALRSLGQWAGDPSRERSVVAAVAAAEWIRLLDRLVGSLEAPVAAAAAAARAPWWR